MAPQIEGAPCVVQRCATLAEKWGSLASTMVAPEERLEANRSAQLHADVDAVVDAILPRDSACRKAPLINIVTAIGNI